METQQPVHQEAQTPWTSYLIARFHTTKPLDPHSSMEAIHSHWNLHQHSLRISLLGSNLFAMCFRRFQDQKHILDQQPWEIGSHLLILKEIHKHQNPRYIQLSYVPMWFSFSGLHSEHYDHKIIRDIAKAVGTVLSIDPTEDEGFPKSEKGFRVRVDVQVLLPLPRGTFVRTQKDGLIWVSIVPERLPSEFCNKCLLLGHQDIAHHQGLNPSHYYQAQLDPLLQLECRTYRSFYSATDPRMIHIGGKMESQNCDSVIVNFIEGRGPPPREFTQEMVKQLFDYLLTSRGRSFLKRLGLVAVPISEGEEIVINTNADQSGDQPRALTRQMVQLFSAARINLLNSARQGDCGNVQANSSVHNQNLQTTVKIENEEEPLPLPHYESESSIC